MRKGLHGLMLAALMLAGAVRAEDDGVLVLPLEEALERALAHNRELVKGALDLQSSLLSVEAAREAAVGLQITPDGALGAGPDGD